MSEKRPNVFESKKVEQTKENIPFTPNLGDKKVISGDSDYEREKINVSNTVYTNAMSETGIEAIEAMRKRTEEQIKLRDEMLRKNNEQTQTYHEQYTNIEKTKPVQQEAKQETKPLVKVISNEDDKITILSQPDYNSAFDLIPLPSEGKLYKGKGSSVRVAYITTMDENILSSPNLLKSGKFLEILMNRKILDANLRYRDLHIGDRNAIMLWLRATAYGEMYPVTIYDKEGEPFETEIDLNTLTTKKLGAVPDENGYFDFYLPVSKKNIKFKLLTVGDIEDIDNQNAIDEENGLLVDMSNTYRLRKTIISIEDNQDTNYIYDFINKMRPKDSKDLRKYINDVESGVNLEIDVKTPRGESLRTFFPLNFNFFWPDFRL
jgi:hypothetical protein